MTNPEQPARCGDDAMQIKALAISAATLDSVYQWLDRVDADGGPTCIAGIASTKAMLDSLRKNRGRMETLVMEPARTAIARATQGHSGREG